MRALIFAASLLTASTAFAQAPQTSTSAPKAPPAAASTATTAKAAPLDINSASAAELQALKGIGCDHQGPSLQGQGRSGAEENHHAGRL
jgi:DNA uptake protein ComE-like DNA-binding protein